MGTYCVTDEGLKIVVTYDLPKLVPRTFQSGEAKGSGTCRPKAPARGCLRPSATWPGGLSAAHRLVSSHTRTGML